MNLDQVRRAQQLATLGFAIAASALLSFGLAVALFAVFEEMAVFT